MTAGQLRDKLQDEIRELPDSRLQDVHDLIQVFRAGLKRERGRGQADVRRFAVTWGDMDDFEADIRSRRHAAFSSRKRHEARAD